MASPSRAPHSNVPRHHHAPQTRTRQAPASNGTATPESSITTTITSTPPSRDGLVLRLRGAHDPQTQTSESTNTARTRHIQWAEGVIDNEGLGRKKSKVCCIYHKTREFGESSSEEDSSSNEDSDDSGDDGAARPVGGYGRGRGKKGSGKAHKHDHGDGDGCDKHEHGDKAKRKPSPNAYERMPRYDVKPLNGRPPT